MKIQLKLNWNEKLMIKIKNIFCVIVLFTVSCSNVSLNELPKTESLNYILNYLLIFERLKIDQAKINYTPNYLQEIERNKVKKQTMIHSSSGNEFVYTFDENSRIALIKKHSKNKLIDNIEIKYEYKNNNYLDVYENNNLVYEVYKKDNYYGIKSNSKFLDLNKT